MDSKIEAIAMLRDELKQWEELLAGMTEAEIVEPKLHSNWSIKDVVAHLYAWQQLSIARMQAAINDAQPQFDWWPHALDADEAHDVDKINVWIYKTFKDKSWNEVYIDWKQGFLKFIELGETVSEQDLLTPDKYDWLIGHPLMLILQGSYNHHQEDHREPLVKWLKE